MNFLYWDRPGLTLLYLNAARSRNVTQWIIGPIWG